VCSTSGWSLSNHLLKNCDIYMLEHIRLNALITADCSRHLEQDMYRHKLVPVPCRSVLCCVLRSQETWTPAPRALRRRPTEVTGCHFHLPHHFPATHQSTSSTLTAVRVQIACNTCTCAETSAYQVHIL